MSGTSERHAQLRATQTRASQHVDDWLAANDLVEI